MLKQMLGSTTVRVLLLILAGTVVDGLLVVNEHGWTWAELKEHVLVAGLTAAMIYLRRAIGFNGEAVKK